MKDPTQILYLEYALYGLLLVFFITVIAMLWISHRAKKYPNFDMLQLIMTKEGFLHRPGLFETVACVTMTWGFIVYVVRGTLSEWYAGLYVAAFIARGAYAAFLSSKKPTNGTTPPTSPTQGMMAG